VQRAPARRYGLIGSCSGRASSYDPRRPRRHATSISTVAADIYGWIFAQRNREACHDVLGTEHTVSLVPLTAALSLSSASCFSGIQSRASSLTRRLSPSSLSRNFQIAAAIRYRDAFPDSGDGWC
jgi:hypothetical protein